MSRKTDISLGPIDDLASKLINYGKESKEKDQFLCQIINCPKRNIIFATLEMNFWCFEATTKTVKKIHCAMVRVMILPKNNNKVQLNIRFHPNTFHHNHQLKKNVHLMLTLYSASIGQKGFSWDERGFCCFSSRPFCFLAENIAAALSSSRWSKAGKSVGDSRPFWSHKTHSTL